MSSSRRGKQSAYFCFKSAPFFFRVSWKEMVSMHSQTAAMTGPGNRYPASAGSDAVSSVFGGRTCGFFGVGGGTTCSGTQICGGMEGWLRMLYPTCLSIAVWASASITMWHPTMNGIPKIIGTDKPSLTFAWMTPDFQVPCPQESSNFTYSVQVRGVLERELRLSSSVGRW